MATLDGDQLELLEYSAPTVLDNLGVSYWSSALLNLSSRFNLLSSSVQYHRYLRYGGYWRSAQRRNLSSYRRSDQCIPRFIGSGCESGFASDFQFVGQWRDWRWYCEWIGSRMSHRHYQSTISCSLMYWCWILLICNNCYLVETVNW